LSSQNNNNNNNNNNKARPPAPWVGGITKTAQISFAPVRTFHTSRARGADHLGTRGSLLTAARRVPPPCLALRERAVSLPATSLGTGRPC
jgi:hypothetical protein